MAVATAQVIRGLLPHVPVGVEGIPGNEARGLRGPTPLPSVASGARRRVGAASCATSAFLAVFGVRRSARAAHRRRVCSSARPQPGRGGSVAKLRGVSSEMCGGCFVEASTVLLIDGDNVGPQEVKEAVSAISMKGTLVGGVLFHAPGVSYKPAFLSFLEDNHIRCQTVVRNAGFAQDPNDFAIWVEARRLAKSEVQCIALLVRDQDFIPLAMKLIQEGKEATAVLSAPRSSFLTRKFVHAGVPVLLLRGEDTVRNYGIKAYLLPDGSGGVDVLSSPDPEPPDIDLATYEAITRHLRALGYLSATSSLISPRELVPAIAKFWYTCNMDKLVVFPYTFALRSMSNLLRTRPNEFEHARDRDLAFVLPLKNSSHKRYGSIPAGRIAKGGGPAMMEDTPDLACRFLRRFGYLDSDLNCDVDEAALVCGQMTRNKRRLVKLGLFSADKSPGLGEIRTALLSDADGATWQLPPEGGLLVIKHLVSHKFLNSIGASKEEVYYALRRACKAHGLCTMKTYNGYLWLFMREVLHRKDPSRRA